ncbi:MAG: AI-2E family transporter [Magnetococcales bacterium]|nr:AI-2E family transporter [Magnetococcales bacterium]NGZ25717.1 AI-2E family transporter [Magnetococcales bacterium]
MPQSQTPLQNQLQKFLRLLENGQVWAMILVLTASVMLLGFFGNALAPVLTAVVLAYLLEGMVRVLVAWRIPRQLAVMLVFGLFMLLLNLVIFVLAPNLVTQLTKLSSEAPRINQTLRDGLRMLSESAAGLVNTSFAENLLVWLVEGSQNVATKALTYLLQSIPGMLSLLLYLFLVPFLVFFYLKDKVELLNYLRRFLPEERGLLNRVLRKVDRGIGGYVRGKFWEMMILGSVTYLVFVVMEVQYAFLLALLTALSVLIPFLGVAAVTVPVLILGLIQWGLTWDALNPFIAYAILQLVDGTVLAPVILGEAVNLHPTTIIVAVLFFGSLWGLLGVFFAVPLAILIKTVVESLPSSDGMTSLDNAIG